MMLRRCMGFASAIGVVLLSDPAFSQASDYVRTDPHVRLRTQAGLPVASAVGDIRILNEAYLAGGGASSLVARRGRSGRWTVSFVIQRPGDPTQSWTLGRTTAAALEKVLHDPGAFAPQPAPAEFASCLDPPFTRTEVSWKGRTEVIQQDCGTWGAVARIQNLLESGMPD